MLRTHTEWVEDGRAVLFFDDGFLEERNNVRLRYHTPAKCPDSAVMEPELPWEGGRIQPWGSVFPWEGKWRVLCNGYCTPENGVFLLETEDGKKWTRPSLGLHEYNGSKDNSLLRPNPCPGNGFEFLPSLIRHPNPPDGSWTWLLYLWQRGSTADGGRFCGLYVLKSADGLRFEKAREEPILESRHGYGPGLCNDVVSVYYDTQAGCFTMYGAVMLPVAPGNEVPWDNVPNAVRRIARWDSADGLEWDGPHYILEPDRDEPARQQYYGMTVSEYEGLWLGFPLYYHVAEQFMHPHLLVSHDRRVWNRLSRLPFIPSGDTPVRWDHGGIFPAWDFLRLGDELIFPYGGLNQREHTGRSRMSFGYATLRKDGFVSLSPGGAGAQWCSFQSVPIRNAGGKMLRLNTAPDWHTDERWVSVAVETADGGPVPGYALEDCGHVEADGTAVAIRWGDRTRLPEMDGLRLRVELMRQQLFAIRFE